MTVEKALKFQFVLDDTSFNRVKRALDDIIAKSKELAKVLGGAQTGGGSLLSGGNVGRPPSAIGTLATGGGAQTQIGRVVLDNAAAFKNMANMGSGAMKGLTDVLKTSIARQRQEIDTLRTALDRLGQTYEKLGGQGRKAAAVQGAMINVAGRISTGQDSLYQLQEIGHKELMPHIPWPGQGGSAGVPGAGGGGGGAGGGGKGPIGFPPGMPGSGSPMLNWFLGNTMGAKAARVGGAAMAGLSLGYGVTQAFQAGNNLQLDVNAQRGAAVAPSWQRMRRGDYSEMAAMHFIAKQSPEARQRILQSVGSTEADFTDVVGGVKGLFSGEMTGMTMAGMDTKKYQRFQEMMGKVQGTMGFQATYGRAMEYVDQSRGDRQGMSRAGLGGFYFDKKSGEFKDYYSRTAQALEAGAWSAGELIGANIQARNSAGRTFAKQYAWNIMGANASGYGGVGELLAASARGRGTLFGSKSLAQGALGGGIDTAAGIQLGTNLFGYDPRSGTSGRGALGAIQAGMSFNGGPGDFNSVARAGLAMGAGDRLTSGFDPYQQGRNIVSAIGLMPGGTTYAQDSLGTRSSFKELLELAQGGTSARSRAYGYGKGEAQGQLANMGSSIFDRFVDQGGSDNVSKAIRAMRASGQSMPDFMRSLSKGGKAGRAQLEAMGVYMSDEMGLDTEAGIGLAEMYSGVSGLDKRGLKHGKLPFGSVDDLEKQQREQAVIELQKNEDALKKVIGGIVDAIKSLGGGEEKTKGFGMLQGNVETLIDSFGRLSTATENLIGKMGGSTTGQILGRTGGSGSTKAGPPTYGKPSDRPGSANRKDF